MYNQYLKQTPPTLKRNKDLDDCIICDIDWTLALKGDRDIYDWSKVYLDTVIEPTANIINRASHDWHDIILVSWRSNEFRTVTEKRLTDNKIFYNKLYMRKEWDNRCDTIVKKELYEEHIMYEYNVSFVIDDRPKVVRMRREQWLFVLDVNQTGLEF
jgi:hypothetical protein